MAGREREVKVVVLGEDKGASKALNQVDKAAAKLGPTGKVAENALQGVTSKLTSGLGPASGQAEAALNKMGGSALSSGNMLGTALAGGALMAGAALAKFAMDGVGKLVDLAGEVRNFSRATGLGSEDASRMVSVLDDLGISSDVGAGALFKLAKNAGDGGEKLGKFGIEVAKSKDGTLDLMGTLLNVADAYTKTTDQGKRAELVMGAFGKAGQQLIPILEKGRDGIQEMFDAVKRGEILSDKDIADARRFELALDDAQDSLRTLQMEGGRALLPYISSVTEAATKTLDFIESKGARAGGVKGLFDSILTSTIPAAHGLKLFGLGEDEAGKAAEGAAAKFDLQVVALGDLGVEVSDAEMATGELTEATKKQAAEAEKYKAKIEGMATSMSAAYNTMTGKTGELTEKQRTMATAFDTATTSANQLKAGLDMLVGVHLTAAQASIAWEEKIDSISGALGANKRSLDITTEAGRANQTAIIGMIQTGLTHIDALGREGASSQAVAAAYNDHVAALRRVMTQAGYTTSEIDTLLGKYGLLAAAPDISKNITATFTDVFVTKGDRTHGGTSTSGIRQFALGMDMGPVPGGRNEMVPILAHGGEWVVTPEQMGRLRGGGGTRSASSSAGDANVYVTVGTLVGSDGMHELGEVVREQLLKTQQRTPLGFA